MPISPRIQVILKPELDKKVTELANGNKSGFCAELIAQGIERLEKGKQLIEGSKERLGKK